MDFGMPDELAHILTREEIVYLEAEFCQYEYHSCTTIEDICWSLCSYICECISMEREADWWWDDGGDYSYLDAPQIAYEIRNKLGCSWCCDWGELVECKPQ